MVSCQNHRANLNCFDNHDTVSNSFIWFHFKIETVAWKVKPLSIPIFLDSRVTKTNWSCAFSYSSIWIIDSKTRYGFDILFLHQTLALISLGKTTRRTTTMLFSRSVAYNHFITVATIRTNPMDFLSWIRSYNIRCNAVSFVVPLFMFGKSIAVIYSSATISSASASFSGSSSVSGSIPAMLSLKT